MRVHGAKGITHLSIPVPFGKGGMGDFGSLFRYRQDRGKRQAHRRSSAQVLVANYTALHSETK
jgi:hypothetical protein